MSCASCGKEVPAGARYCVHCGAEQSVPTPIAAVAAAAMSQASRARAANAAQAEPPVGPALQAANQASAAPGAAEHVPGTDTGESATRPAYADDPPRGGFAIALIGACVLAAIAIAVIFLSRMQGGGLESIMGSQRTDRDASLARSGAPPATETPALSVPAPATPASDASASDASAAGGEATSTPATAPGPTGTAAESVPVEIKPLPPKPAPTKAAKRPHPEKAPAPAVPAEPPKPPESAPAPIARAPAAPPAVMPVAERWVRMDDELSRCTREDFITRVICSQRVRFRYCEGYWGKTARCPANPAPERGQ